MVSMVGPPANARRLAGRFLDFSLLGLVASGYFALVGSGFFDVPSTALTGAGLLLRALVLTGLLKFDIPPRLLTAATIVYLVFCPLDYFIFSRDFLRATVHLICFLAVARILTARTDRDYVYVKIIAFLELLAAAVLSSNLSFFVFLAWFLLFGVATFTSSEIARGTRAPLLIARAGLNRFHLRLAALSLLIAVGILAFTGVFFFVLPRTAHAAFRRLAPERYYLPGFSDEVRLGAIGEVLQENTPIMHVLFRDEKRPLFLKWRGAVLGRFDGKRWFNPPAGGGLVPVRERPVIVASDDQRRRKGFRVTYEVRLRSIGGDALFFAGVPEAIWIDAPMLRRTPSGAYRLGMAPSDDVRYAAMSFVPRTDEGGSLDDAPGKGSAYLQLPKLDSRIPALTLRAAGGITSPGARARAIERYLRSVYAYTLELPDVEKDDPLAEFLFVRRKGHCEYFASAMAVMLRTSGIPSRVVTGFQGGTLNPITGWHVIRGSDAHSWVEAWLPGEGWVVFDPTPPGPDSRHESWWTKLFLYVDAAETFWQEWVVNYDLDRQLTLATRVGSSGRGLSTRWLDRLRLAGMEGKEYLTRWLRDYAAAMGLSAVLALLALLYGPSVLRLFRARAGLRRALRGQAQSSDATLLYNRALSLLERKGFHRSPWQTPVEFAASIPDAAAAVVIRDLTLAYNELRYGRHTAAAPRMTALLDRLERL